MYESIATVTVGSGGSSSVTFSSIPQTYTHLQLRMLLRSTGGSALTFGKIYFNSDTTNANYAAHRLSGNGSSAISGATTTDGSFGDFAGPSALSNVFGVSIVDIFDYTNTNKYTTSRYFNGVETNTYGDVRISSQLWENTAAITSLSISQWDNDPFVQYSHFALYGIKG
jgi:hypothetical protein